MATYSLMVMPASSARARTTFPRGRAGLVMIESRSPLVGRQPLGWRAMPTLNRTFDSDSLPSWACRGVSGSTLLVDPEPGLDGGSGRRGRRRPELHRVEAAGRGLRAGRAVAAAGHRHRHPPAVREAAHPRD